MKSRRKEELSTLQKIAALILLAGFLVLTLHSAFHDPHRVTLMFGLEFAALLFVFADSFTHEFDYIPEDKPDAREVPKHVAGSVEGAEEGG